MTVSPPNRRRFLQLAASAVTASAVSSISARPTSAQPADGSRTPIRLGAPVFQPPQDPEELALAHRRLGYRAAYCPAVNLDDADRIREIRRAFEKHDVVIGEVGRWCNLLDADQQKRTENLQRVIDGLALAEALDARCCVNIAGSYNQDIWYGPHPDNLSERFFDAAVENARKIIDSVKPKRAKFCYEMMGWALPDSVDSYRKMIDAVDREAFGVHLDPCNLINSPQRFYENALLIRQCFEQLGPWLVSCHAKDVAWEVEMQVHFREVTLGAGSLDYGTYLKCLAALPRDVPLMIEHMQGPEEYLKSRDFVIAVAGELGIPVAN